MPYLLTRNRDLEFCARIEVPGREAVIGRGQNAAIRIDDRSVSKIHASITPVPGSQGRYVLRDLGSRNGVIFRGSTHQEVEIGLGDEFRLGQVHFTLCGEGGETRPVAAGEGRRTPQRSKTPRSAAAPEMVPSRSRDPESSVMWSSLLDSTERNLLIAVIVVLVILGGALWVLQPWKGETPDPAGGESAKPETASVEPSGEDDPEEIPEVVDERVRVWQELDARRAPWVALATDLDRQCATAGCHDVAPEIDFHESSRPELGRQERNLLMLRQRTRIALTAEDTWVLQPFASRAPHDQPMPVTLTEDGVRGVRLLATSAGRLLEPDPAEFDLLALEKVGDAELRRVRRAWRLLYGRLPTGTEIVEFADSGPDRWLDEARQRAEHWRERARAVLRGHGTFAADGGFQLPATLTPGEVPANPGEWIAALKREKKRAGDAVRHPYGAPPPLPDATGEDSAYRGWFMAELPGEPRPWPPDAMLRSLWSVLHGAPPERSDEGHFVAALRSGLEWGELWPRAVNLLVHAPRTPVPPVPVDAAGDWADAMNRLCAGKGLTGSARSALAIQLKSGSLDARTLVAESILGVAWGPAAPAPAGPADPTSPETEAGRVTIEVLCSFPVRELLRQPQQIPRLWKRFEEALVETFAVDTSELTALARHDRERAARKGRLLVTHRSWLPSLAREDRVLAADGFLLVPFGTLADQWGEPRVGRLESARRQELRRLIGSPRSEPDSTPRADDLFKAGGYRLLEAEWESGVHRPATRTLLLARALLARKSLDRTLPVTVWVPMPAPPGGDDRHWEEFSQTLELLALEAPERSFDLWLWGPATEGGTETVHISWGPHVERGWVWHREPELARRFHPFLADFAPDPSGGGDDDGETPR